MVEESDAFLRLSELKPDDPASPKDPCLPDDVLDASELVELFLLPPDVPSTERDPRLGTASITKGVSALGVGIEWASVKPGGAMEGE